MVSMVALASALVAQAPAVEMSSATALDTRYLTFTPSWLTWDVTIHRGTEELQAGWFAGNLAEVVRGSDEAAKHAKTARAFAYTRLGMAVAGVAAITTAGILQANDRLSMRDATYVYSASLSLSLIYSFISGHGQQLAVAQAVNAYNRDLVAGRLQ